MDEARIARSLAWLQRLRSGRRAAVARTSAAG